MNEYMHSLESDQYTFWHSEMSPKITETRFTIYCKLTKEKKINTFVE